MKRKRTPRTQKQKAIRYALVFVFCLVVAQAFHVVCLTPMQTIRATEWRMGLEPTEIVMAKDNIYLSENETVLLLTEHTPSPVDLTPPPVLSLDKSQGLSAPAGFYLIDDTINGTTTIHLVGQVFLDDAHSILVRNRDPLSPTVVSTELTADIITGEDGGRYFWSVTELPKNDMFVLPSDLEVLDASGKVLDTHSVLPGTHMTIQ